MVRTRSEYTSHSSLSLTKMRGEPFRPAEIVTRASEILQKAEGGTASGRIRAARMRAMLDEQIEFAQRENLRMSLMIDTLKRQLESGSKTLDRLQHQQDQ